MLFLCCSQSRNLGIIFKLFFSLKPSFHTFIGFANDISSVHVITTVLSTFIISWWDFSNNHLFNLLLINVSYHCFDCLHGDKDCVYFIFCLKLLNKIGQRKQLGTCLTEESLLRWHQSINQYPWISLVQPIVMQYTWKSSIMPTTLHENINTDMAWPGWNPNTQYLQKV